eukprot:3050236-Pleurochrysis_carterae.AAC.2
MSQLPPRAPFHRLHAQFLELSSHHMRTCEALALRFQSFELPACGWPPPFASALTQSRPVGPLSPHACARSPTMGSRYHTSIIISCPARVVALGRSRVVKIYMVHAK